MQCAVGIQRDADRIRVMLAQHGPVSARAVILATGATYRRLGIPELEELNGAGVFYGGPAAEAARASRGSRCTSWAAPTPPGRRRCTWRATPRA